MKMINQCSGLV